MRILYERGGRYKGMDKYIGMLEGASKEYEYSELELRKITALLDYCHAVDVHRIHKGMYEVFFKCDAMPGREITIDFCSNECARFGCSNCTAAEDAEDIINKEKVVPEFEPTDE